MSSDSVVEVVAADKLGKQMIVAVRKLGREPVGREILQEIGGELKWLVQSPTTGGSKETATLVMIPLTVDSLPMEGCHLSVVGVLDEKQFTATVAKYYEA